MLGVRREGVTESALKLRTAKLIRYARGHITVLDRSGLEQRSCECYAMVNKECDRLLSAGSIDPAHALGIDGPRAFPLATGRGRLEEPA